MPLLLYTFLPSTRLLYSSLAALGLVENNAPNIVAAMLVSPLMGPVMSITFGAIISDKELMVSAVSPIWWLWLFRCTTHFCRDQQIV